METPLEHILMNAYKEDMISFLHEHTEYFTEAVTLALGDKQPHSWRSAWLLYSCVAEHDSRLIKYIDSLLEVLPKKKDGHQRELIKILLKMNLNDDQEGRLFDICANIWEKIGKRPSVRYTAFMFMYEVAKKYPELSNEISFFVQDQYIETLSPGIKNAIIRLTKKPN